MIKLDRLGRSLGFLCELVERFKGQGVGFHSLTDGIDTTTTGGKLVFHIMGALSEFERDLIKERTKAGMKAAKNAVNMSDNQNPCQKDKFSICMNY